MANQPDRWTYQHTDTGDLLRRARRFLAQWTDIPAPSTRVAGDSSPQLVYLLACEIERLEQRNADLRAALHDLTMRCDGEEGMRADGSNIQTMWAHAALEGGYVSPRKETA